jgi:hypothetical protein
MLGVAATRSEIVDPYPVFTAAAILTLVLGIGSVAAMFAIVLGAARTTGLTAHPDRLVSVQPRFANR